MDKFAVDKFVVDSGVQILLKDIGLAEQDVLRLAGLPVDLFSRKSITLTTAEYFQLWGAMERLADDPLFPLTLANAVTVESFGPPIFACFCSPNLTIAFKRLSQYKRLVGPMRLDLSDNNGETLISLSGMGADIDFPPSFIAMELVYMINIVRLATRENIRPKEVYSSVPIPEMEQYERYMGTHITVSDHNSLLFSVEDSRRPFLSANEDMWNAFEPSLKSSLADLSAQSGFGERVKACLMEMIASGSCSLDDVARRLGVSSRTMQRRLREEDLSFQQILNALREELAHHYLAHTSYSGAEISFLLGYDDPNSFIRAFQSWTGKTPEVVRMLSTQVE